MEYESIKKSFFRLIEDYICELSFYPEEEGFILAGTEGVIIDCHTIKLIPNLSDEKHAEIVHRELIAKCQAQYLILISGKIISIPVENLEHVRSEGYPIFEDDEDRNNYFDDQHKEYARQYLEMKNDAST